VFACHAEISAQLSGVAAMPFEPVIPISVQRSTM
jgi:hypothetical protein